MAIGDVFQLDLLYEIPGKQGAMVFHFLQLSASPGAAALDAQFCAEVCTDPLALGLAPLMPDSLNFLGGYCRQATIGTPGAYPNLYLMSSPEPGTRTGTEMLPEGQGPLVLVGPDSISASPRRQVNRKYFPVMLEGDQDAGAISSSFVGSIESGLGGLVDPASFNDDFQWCTYSRTAEAEASTFSWPVESIRVSDQIARIVRRRPRYQGRS